MTDFDVSLKAWLDTPEDDRNLAEGAKMLLQLTGNRYMYANITRRLSGNAGFIARELEKHYRFRAANMSGKEFDRLKVTANRICRDFFGADADSRPPKETQIDQRSGRREDHDSLPENIRNLYVKNLDIRHKMQQIHLELRLLLRRKAECSPADFVDLVQILIKYDKQYRRNWDIYDSFVAS